MDPATALGVAASVAQPLHVTRRVLKFLIDYKESGDEISRGIEELSDLSNDLEALTSVELSFKRINHDAYSTPSEISKLRDLMEELHRNLKKRRDNILKRWKWPYVINKTMDSIKELRQKLLTAITTAQL